MKNKYKIGIVLSIIALCIVLFSSFQKGKKEVILLNEAEKESLKIAFDAAMVLEMKNNHIPGIGLVVVQNGKTIYKKGYGIANTDTGTKVDPDKTIFRIGSISKALTLLTLSKMVDQQRLSYNDDVSKYISGIKNPNSYGDPVRIENLMTHTTGFDQIGIGRHIWDTELPLSTRKAKRPSIEEFLESNNLRRVSPAGAYYRYDTYGTTLAGAVLEKVTGLSYKKAMKELLFNPLGMTKSSVEIAEHEMHNLAVGHGYIDSAYHVMPYEVYMTTPASSIDASVADMGRLLEALTGDGSNENGRLFSEKMINDIMKTQYRPHPDFVGVSHGLMESVLVGLFPDAYPIRTLGHGGSMLGVSTNMIIIPSLKIGIFAAANRNGEAGGGRVSMWRPVMNTLAENLGIEKVKDPYPISKSRKEVDISPYEGDYVFGIFCHSCTEEEYNQGGWRRSAPIKVEAKDGVLLIGADSYIPQGNDVFVRKDGGEMAYFGRNEKGEPSFLVFKDDNTAFEKIDQ